MPSPTRHHQPAKLGTGTRFHDLRHTYAAFLIAEGAHPRAIMERMGHSTINVTLGTYGHMFPAIDEQLDEALATRFGRASAAHVRETSVARRSTFPTDRRNASSKA
ncbi:MAG: tyrosine-type recombinase/integrase [bacterium]|nr:tyrosine-type recombinase/integrase [bacterium]